MTFGELKQGDWFLFQGKMFLKCNDHVDDNLSTISRAVSSDGQVLQFFNDWLIHKLEDAIISSTSQLKVLRDDQFKLHCLQHAGVDNWEGYDIAMEEYNEQEN